MVGKRGPVAERFERKYIPEPNSGCWLWTGALVSKGYGCIWMPERRSMVAAHRVSYEMHMGPIPDNLQLDHLCRMRCCVNPAHLEPVTALENTRRGRQRELARKRSLRRNHCPNGHLYSAVNTHIDPKGGWRECKTCWRITAQRQRDRKKNARLAVLEKGIRL